MLQSRRIGLVVQHASGNGPKLFAAVPVYRQPVRNLHTRRADGSIQSHVHAPDQTAVSPALVRRIIEYALRNGWTPSARAPEFVISEDALRSLL